MSRVVGGVRFALPRERCTREGCAEPASVELAEVITTSSGRRIESTAPLCSACARAKHSSTTPHRTITVTTRPLRWSTR